MILLGPGSRGDLVKQIQRGLGLVPDDGIYGNHTAESVRAAQTYAQLPVTGAVDEATWDAITDGAPVPDLFLRCLNLTGCFEGTSYGGSAGDWDGAGTTWGIIGFNLKSNSLKPVFDKIPVNVIIWCFGEAGSSEFRTVLESSSTRRLGWGASISDPETRKTKLIEPWKSRFAALGVCPEAIEAQIAVARDLYWIPSQKTLTTQIPWLVSSPRAAAMCFDCHVQQGSVHRDAIEAARVASPEGPTASLSALARKQATGTYAADILERRLTIATGSGMVHKRMYDLRAYGL